MRNRADEDAARQAARWLGARGGKKGGVARWRGVSKAERSRAMKEIRAQALVKKKFCLAAVFALLAAMTAFAPINWSGNDADDVMDLLHPEVMERQG
jgi:hypothetical protein